MRLVSAHLVDNRLEPRKHSVYGLSIQLHKVLVLSLMCIKESILYLIIALMEFLEGGLDLVSQSQMSNSLKLTKRETREQSVSSFVVRIMELHLNWSYSGTLNIERNIETNHPDMIPNTLKICRHVNHLVQLICPIEE
jgi:hypothetical protein